MKQYRSYSLFQHVIGIDHTPHTAVEEVSIKVHSEASIEDMYEAFKSFLYAVGYSPVGVQNFFSQPLEDEVDPELELIKDLMR